MNKKTPEEILLGALVVDPLAIADMAGRISPADFEDRPLGELFTTLADMVDSQKPLSLVSIVAELQLSGLLQRLGGHARIGRLADRSVTRSEARQYADEIRQASAKRRLAKLAEQMASAAADPRQKPEDLIALIEAEASRIGAGTTTERLTTLAEATRSLIAKQKRTDREQGRAVLTGLWCLDESLGGLYGGELVVLAARPSIGKSSLATQIGIHAAERSGGVLFVSLEMTDEDLAAREIASELGTEVRAVRSGHFDLGAAAAFAERIEGVPFKIHYGRSCTVRSVRGLARLMAAQPAGLRLIVVDYIGLMTASDRRKPRWEQVSEISADLKSLALELGVPVLAACQLGRDAEGRAPTIAQLRDSGAIEQDADLVMLLHRETRDSADATLEIAKARNGATGTLRLRFDCETTSFRDYEEPL